MMHRVLCCGGRDYRDANFVSDTLNQLASTLGVFAVIHGGARGADSLCGYWAKQKGFPEIVIPANWDYFGKRAGTVRNSWMLDICQPSYAVAFPGGVGTADMVRRLNEAGVTVWQPAGVYKMDDADITDEREEKELAARIAQARKTIPIHERPVLGCGPCSDLTQKQAERDCEFYAACLADWERDVKIINKLKGK